MAGVPFAFNGVLYDKLNRTQQTVFLTGIAYNPDLSVGGGPIYPELPPGGGGHPEHPIVPPGGYPHPEHPIVIPPPIDPPEVPPNTPPGTVVKPPPADGGWGFTHPYGWAYFPGPGDKGPKAAAAPRK